MNMNDQQTATAPLRLDVLNEILACVDAEPEFPDEMPKEMQAAFYTMMVNRDMPMLIETLRMAVRETKRGIRERILSQCGEMTRCQAYTWEHPNGTKVTWNITKAIELTNGRKPDHHLSLGHIAQICSRNPHFGSLDQVYAMTRDLSIPLISTRAPVTEPGIWSGGNSPVIMIDGWHRMLKAILTKHAQPLPVIILTPEEDAACRIPLH